jgi:hypothetical protein
MLKEEKEPKPTRIHLVMPRSRMKMYAIKGIEGTGYPFYVTPNQEIGFHDLL